MFKFFIFSIIFATFCLNSILCRPQAPSEGTSTPSPPPVAVGNGQEKVPDKTKNVTIIKSESMIPGDGTFKYDFELSDGTKSEQHGRLINAGTPNEGVAIEGSYSFVGTDGKTYSVTYTADENGFQPKGAHIPIVKSAPGNSTDPEANTTNSPQTQLSSSSTPVPAPNATN